jgi:hypothetical protein
MGLQRVSDACAVPGAGCFHLGVKVINNSFTTSGALELENANNLPIMIIMAC